MPYNGSVLLRPQPAIVKKPLHSLDQTLIHLWDPDYANKLEEI
jgi:hypothetical protein